MGNAHVVPRPTSSSSSLLSPQISSSTNVNHGQLLPTQAATKLPPSACLFLSLPLRYSLSYSRPFSLSTRFLFLPLSLFRLARSPPFGAQCRTCASQGGSKVVKTAGASFLVAQLQRWRSERGMQFHHNFSSCFTIFQPILVANMGANQFLSTSSS